MYKMLLTLAIFGASLFGAANHTATLIWQDSINPPGTMYNVYRSVSICPPGTNTSIRIASNIDTKVDNTPKIYDDVSISPGTYCYTITATDGVAESPPEMIQGNVPSSTLAPVTQLQIIIK